MLITYVPRLILNCNFETVKDKVCSIGIADMLHFYIAVICPVLQFTCKYHERTVYCIESMQRCAVYIPHTAFDRD